MNGYLAANVYINTSFRVAFKMNEVMNPSPSDTFVFVEERADTIDNNFFAVGSLAFLDPSGNGTRWLEIPANYHGNATVFGFADGHASIRRWLRPLPPAGRVFNDNGFPLSPKNPDCLWLFDHATGRK